MSFKDKITTGSGWAFGAIYVLGALMLWWLATAWYVKQWGILGVLANIILVPIFMAAFPFIFWIKEGALPWLWIFIFAGILLAHLILGFILSLFDRR